MDTGNPYRGDAGRGLEMVCGFVLLLPTLLLLGGALTIVVLAPWQIGSLVAALLLTLIGLGLLRISIRLLQGRGRSDGGLLSPGAIAAGATLFAVVGLVFIIFGIAEHKAVAVVTGIANLPAGYFAWRLSRARRRQNQTGRPPAGRPPRQPD